MFSLMCLVTGGKINTLSIAMQGITVGLMVLTKQYLGLMILIPTCVIVFATALTWRKKIGHTLVLLISICLVLSPWVARNYISSGKIIVFFGETSGLRNALDDMMAFTRFANKFNENITESVRSVANTGTVKFSKHHDFVARHQTDIDAAAFLAYQCGGSFQEWRQHTSLNQLPYKNCNETIVSRFNNLNAQFWKEVPFWDAMESRRDSLSKIFQKSRLVNDLPISNKEISLNYILLTYRVFLLGLGLAALLYLLVIAGKRREQRLLTGSLLMTSLGFYFFFCLVMVQAEMRYLLTPDLLVSIFSGVIPGILIQRFCTGAISKTNACNRRKSNEEKIFVTRKCMRKAN